MMNSYRTRLTLIFVVMIGLSVTAAGFFMARMYKENHIDVLEQNLIREMQVIAARTPWKEGEPAQLFGYFTSEAVSLKKLTGARVTFIRGDGTVLGDSDHRPETMDNHSQRLEVIQAEAAGVGRAIRRSDTIKENMLYVAMATDPGNPQSNVLRMAFSLREVDADIRQMWTVLMAGLLLLFMASALVSYRVARGMTRPLEQITRVAKRIKNMDYAARVEIGKRDEIGELGFAINSMADSLQVQMNRIQQNESQLESVLDNMINGIVMIDSEGTIQLLNRRAEQVLGFSARELVGRHYTEAKQQYELSGMIQQGLEKREHLHDEITFYFPEERLLELNLVPVVQKDGTFAGVLLVLQDVSAIRRLERMRSEFVANVSHELKTPIAAVKGFAETLLAGAMDDPELSRSFLQIIYDESERLNRLIGDILELSKIESRRVPLQFSPVDLTSFLHKTMQMMKAQAERKSIILDLKVESGIYLEADEDRLRQIVINLLQNGISYTPEGGRVAVDASVRREDAEGGSETVVIRISDTGIGIPKKDLPRIFERFYRVDKARSRSSGGTGLGLSIVKHLVELHKGTISVNSQHGSGSVFTIELPVIQP